MGKHSTFTYREVSQLVTEIASNLMALGIKDRQRVGILSSNSVECLLAILGLLCVSSTAVLLDKADPASRIVQQLRQIDSHLVLTPDDDVPDLKVQVVEIQSLVGKTRGDPFQSEILPTGQIPALIFFTTGSTAAAKPVVQSHYAVALNCSSLVSSLKMNGKTRFLGCLPIRYANGLEFSIFSTMMAGGHVLLLRGFDPFSYCASLKSWSPTLASVVPSILTALLEVPRNVECASLEYFVSAAAPLRRETAIEVWNQFSKRVVQGYGLTETTNFSTLMPSEFSEEEYLRVFAHAEIPPVGVPLEGVEVEVMDSSGEFLDELTEGEVCMRGHTIMDGYLNNDAETAHAFRDGWFHSGDLGMFTPVDTVNGRLYLLSLTGRLKNIVKVAGEAVSLDEVDRALLRLPGIRDAVTYGLPDRFSGEALGATVVADDRTLAAKHIRAELTRVLPLSKIPHRIIFRQDLPRSSNGKVMRALAADEANLRTS